MYVDTQTLWPPPPPTPRSPPPSSLTVLHLARPMIQSWGFSKPVKTAKLAGQPKYIDTHTHPLATPHPRVPTPFLTHCPPSGRSRPMSRSWGFSKPVKTAKLAGLPEYGCTFTPHLAGSSLKASSALFWHSRSISSMNVLPP